MTLWLNVMQVGFCAALLISVLVFGSGLAGGYTLLQFLTLVLLANLILYQCWAKKKLATRPNDLLYLLLLWTGFLWFQFIPLPRPLVNVLSPHLTPLVQKFSAEGISLHWMPATLATYNMFVEAGKKTAYVALFFIAFFLFRDRAHIQKFGSWVVFIGFVVSMVALFFHRYCPGKMYGIFEFEDAAPFTPFLNKNQLANYLVMTIPVTVAYIFFLMDWSFLSKTSSLRDKILWFGSKDALLFFPLVVVSAIQIAALLTACSRGSLLGLASALFLFLFLAVLKSSNKLPAILISLAVLLIVVWSVYQAKPLISKLKVLKLGWANDLALQFRVSNWLGALHLFRDFPLVGIGAGGFHELFPMYKTIPENPSFTQVRFYHAENLVIEGLCETGLFGVGILAAATFVFCGRFFGRWFSLESKTVRWFSLGMFSSIFGMCVHGLFDFSMDMSANAALFAALAGVVGYQISNNHVKIASGVEENTSHSAVFFRSKFFRSGSAIIFVTALFFFVAPILWKQWRSEYHYLKARTSLGQAVQGGKLYPPFIRTALEELTKAKKFGKNQARIDYGFGLSFFYSSLLTGDSSAQRETRFRQAEWHFLRAIGHTPVNASYHYALGHLYEKWGRFEKASLFLERAKMLEPQNPFYRFQFGQNELRLNKVASARDAFRETLRINSRYWEPVAKALANSSIHMSPEKFLDTHF